MLSFRLHNILVLAFLNYINGQRRIKDGVPVTGDKRYMVYLAQAQSSIRDYDNWICGGSIVNRWYILTSAACVEDVQSMYAITGTRRYISSANMYRNECTKHTKKKVVFTCVPKEYELDFNNVVKWSYNDIAIVRVESAYDFDDPLYEKYCDYKPNSVKINLDVNNEQQNLDVIVLGYGHPNYWRHEQEIEPMFEEASARKDVTTNDHVDWNNRYMQFSATKIYSVQKCKKFFKSPDLNDNIDKYMICTNGSGGIGEEGSNFTKSKRKTYREHNIWSTGKYNNLTFDLRTRRQGFCQNDHGGPLVAWIDNVETVIGVASVFRVNSERKCTGPYLFTSTARNKLFIECIIAYQMTRRNNFCDQQAKEKGFSILRRYILWHENEDHVVDNEEIRIRPQLNMNSIRMG